jgi:hypothetical protein
MSRQNSGTPRGFRPIISREPGVCGRGAREPRPRSRRASSPKRRARAVPVPDRVRGGIPPASAGLQRGAPDPTVLREARESPCRRAAPGTRKNAILLAIDRPLFPKEHVHNRKYLVVRAAEAIRLRMIFGSAPRDVLGFSTGDGRPSHVGARVRPSVAISNRATFRPASAGTFSSCLQQPLLC